MQAAIPNGGFTWSTTQLPRLSTTEFPERLADPRKERKLIQKALAERVGVHVTQIQRYENGSGQPTLDEVRWLAVALSVNVDTLVFDKDERGPDDEPRLPFEAVRGFSDEEKQVVKTLLESLILKHDASRFQGQPGR